MRRSPISQAKIELSADQHLSVVAPSPGQPMIVGASFPLFLFSRQPIGVLDDASDESAEGPR